MSQALMDCEARVPRYWPKSCRGGFVPTDVVYNNSCYDPPYISPIAPKKCSVVEHLTADREILGSYPNALFREEEDTWDLSRSVYFCTKHFRIRFYGTQSEVSLTRGSPPGGTTVYQFLHRSISRQVANMNTKNDANLALSPTFGYVSIESLL
ncbi:hypothetical protein TNCV_510791 [Trichonephila clavipes]|nr:hypothetical protein TNCV_510791 [Trichonephila clavipes]